MMKILVLNADYRPIGAVTLQRAINLILLETAEAVEQAEITIKGISIEMPKPLVVRLRKYVRIPDNLGVSYSRRNVLHRDNYTCQYCGVFFEKGRRQDLTVDHIVPKIKGGQSVWTNVVCACKKCNSKKGHKSLEDSGLKLAKRPSKPPRRDMRLLAEHGNETWDKYING